MVETSARPIGEVWARLADGARWSDWAPFSSSDLERRGDPAPDGVGAIRRFGTGPVTSREEVVEFDPPHRFGYRLLSGLPVRGYVAHVELEELPGDGARTRITWRSSWEAETGPAWFWRAFLRTAVQRVARSLARAEP